MIKKINATWIIETFKTSFAVYDVCSVMLLKKIEQSFFGIFSIRIVNQYGSIIRGTESDKEVAKMSKIVVLRLRMRMIC